MYLRLGLTFATWYGDRVHFFDGIPHMYVPPEISSEKNSNYVLVQFLAVSVI